MDVTDIIEMLKDGKVGIMPTDTIFGVVASVRSPSAIDRVYTIKCRERRKKLIHLISHIDQLGELGVTLSSQQEMSLKSLWPASISIEFTCDDSKPYLHNGTYCLAVRLPAHHELAKIIDQTGPIVATSANISGQPVGKTIQEIKDCLPGLDFYMDGSVGTEPSKLVRLHKDGSIEWLAR